MEAHPIRKLEESVINRIAAGEVIQRPVNALKELLENSLDAKSTNIQVTVKNGGLKLLQIQDNGMGIRKEDFEIVCERFTTSKLREFEDLHNISTYGFRGEALASISHIAHLTITSKTHNDVFAYQASFIDSKLQGTPKRIAGNQGTIITVEDLFYNMTVRRKVLKYPNEEYQKIADVISKYAIQNPSVGFALKKSGESNSLRTPQNSNHIDNIRIIYGNAIARELIEFSLINEQFKFRAKGYITNANYSTKRFQFLLFINNRLVECNSLKKCLDEVYSIYLPKNAHPFIYLSLDLDPNNLDVNIHPTKHEVHFLNESQIVECIATGLEQKLLGSNNSRTFFVQAKLPKLYDDKSEECNKTNKATGEKTVNPWTMVRTDAKEQKLEKFFGKTVKKEVFDLNRQKMNESLNEEDFIKQTERYLDEAERFEDCISQGGDEKKYGELQHENMDVINKTVNNGVRCDNQNIEKHVPINVNLNLENQQYIPHSEEYMEVVDNDLENKCENTEVISHKVKVLRNMTEDDQFPKQKKAKYHDMEVDQKDLCFPSTSKGITAPKDTMKSPDKKCELNQSFINKITRVETELTSVLELRAEVEKNCHRALRETFAQHVFVGAIYPHQALIQYSTKLYLCNTKKILAELFYQLIIYNFQNFDRYVFSQKLSINELALICLDLPETGWTPEDGDKTELAQKITEILTNKGPMLDDYFSMKIDEDGYLCSIPVLLENYKPDYVALPMFIVRLATEVNWLTEKECFESFSRETAQFFSQVSEELLEPSKDWKWVTEHVLYPAVKEYFVPPKSFIENAAILEIADLHNLYKVFERC